jgi:hypothetical protein
MTDETPEQEQEQVKGQEAQPQEQQEGQASPTRPKFRRVWREYVLTRAEEVDQEAKQAAMARGLHIDEKGHASLPVDKYELAKMKVYYDSIQQNIQAINAYAKGESSIRSWITGREVEGAWFNVNSAYTNLLILQPNIGGRIAEQLATIRHYLPSDDPRRSCIEARFGSTDCIPTRPITQDELDMLVWASRSANYYAAILNGRVRIIRNAMALASILLTAFVAVLLIFAAWRPGIIPLCFPTPKDGCVCPTGKNHPTAGDVLLMALFGLLGAALSSASVISAAHELPTRYSISPVEIALKLPSGVITSIIGIILLRTAFVLGSFRIESQATILALAFIFGYAQKIFTRMVDKRAQLLLDEASPIHAAHR